MPRIFDNIELVFLPSLEEMLGTAHSADFCVGYFNLRGWNSFGKVVEERPLRIKGIDPARAYSSKELKELKAVNGVDESAPPVIKKIHKSAEPDPMHGLFEVVIGGKACVVEYEPDSDLRDTENMPLLEDGGIEAFINREVLPHVPDAWVDGDKTQIGYEISFTRYFYKPKPMRTLEWSAPSDSDIIGSKAGRRRD